MSSPTLPSLSTHLPKTFDCNIDTSFDLPLPSRHALPTPSSPTHNFLSQTTIPSSLSPRPTLPYQSIILQQKQKLQEYRAKIKQKSKKSNSIKLIPPSCQSPHYQPKTKINTLVQKITLLASRLTKLDDIEKNSKRSSSFESNKYSSHSRSSKYEEGRKLRKQRSIEEIRRIVERPVRAVGGGYREYCPRMERLNYQPISSRNKIKMLFEDRKAREVVLKEHEKKLSQIRSCTILPAYEGKEREMSFRRRQYMMDI